METAPKEPDEPKNLRFLRLLVTVLTAVMIFGILAIVALLVIRLGRPPLPMLPESMELPAGVEVSAFTRGRGWYALVTTDNRILIFDTSTGALRQEIAVTPAAE